MKTILLRSSWQAVNIGDIAHTPGLLHLLEKHLPDASVILWPGSLDLGVEAMLRRRFPKLRIVRDAPSWKPILPQHGDPTIAQAISEAALWLHGSGSGINHQEDLMRWRAESGGKPYGVFGASIGVVIGEREPNLNPAFSPATRDVLDDAAFLFTRETTSLGVIERAKIRCPQMDFVPDATFAVDLRNQKAADVLLHESKLERDKFICAIPRLRFTPYWEINKSNKMSAEDIARRHAVNEKHKNADCAKLRDVITAWVRETGKKVLLCPEMTYEVGLLKPLLYDPLPADIKPNVVPMTRYWLTDEATSVFSAARAVVSMECHSPILANTVSRPGFYLRQPEDTWKGQMYPDLGLGDWKFEIEETTGKQIADRLLEVHTHYPAAVEKAKKASRLAHERYKKAMDVIKTTLV